MGTRIPTLMGTQATRVPGEPSGGPVAAGQHAPRGPVTRAFCAWRGPATRGGESV